MKQFNWITFSLVGVAIVIAPQRAAAQSVWSQSIVGVNNPGTYIGALDFQHANDSSWTQASASRTWTGLDRNGNTRTMGFSGTTINKGSFYGLHSYSKGQVTNSYYNEENPAFYEEGVGFHEDGTPTSLVSLGFAGFNDILHFGGHLESGYRARYIFHLGGFANGDGLMADMGVKIADDPWESFFEFGSGAISTIWATTSHEVNGIDPQTVAVQFSTQYVFDTWLHDDGTNSFGEGNYLSTMNLTGIEMVDANGNVVMDGWTAVGDSGRVYDAVPEPASFTALALGALALRRRRK
jgi:MYXO-CTERM domain-containing protein